MNRSNRPCGPWVAILLAMPVWACATAPIAPIPLPLPETIAWASTAGAADAGAFLGLKTRENVSGSFDDLDFPSGVRVTRVVENSPAAVAGVHTSDVVLKAGATSTDDPGTLEALVRAAAPGDAWTLEVQRGDTVFEVSVLLGAPAGVAAGAETETEAEPLYRLDPARSRAGWLTGRGGVVLVTAAGGSPFVRAGLGVGSVVFAVDGKTMLSDQALIRLLQTYEPGATVRVEALDASGAQRDVSVSLQDQPTRVTEFYLPLVGGYTASVDGDESSFVLIDLWFISLFRYEREGEERRYSILRFIDFATGVGELTR